MRAFNRESYPVSYWILGHVNFKLPTLIGLLLVGSLTISLLDIGDDPPSQTRNITTKEDLVDFVSLMKSLRSASPRMELKNRLKILLVLEVLFCYYP